MRTNTDIMKRCTSKERVEMYSEELHRHVILESNWPKLQTHKGRYLVGYATENGPEFFVTDKENCEYYSNLYNGRVWGCEIPYKNWRSGLKSRR